MYKKCIVCNRLYELNTKWSLKKRKKSKWCSQKCYHSDWDEGRRSKIAKTQKNFIKNETKPKRKERMAKVLKARTESGKWKPPGLGKVKEENYAWKGDNACYSSKHKWIQKHWTKTGTCEDCKTVTKPFGRRKYGTEWANLDGNYNRDDRSTWRELCIKCHRKLDKI